MAKKPVNAEIGTRETVCRSLSYIVNVMMVKAFIFTSVKPPQAGNQKEEAKYQESL